MVGRQQDPIGLFDENIGRRVQEDWFRVLAEGYASSWKTIRESVEEPEIQDSWFGLRRGKIEGAVRRVAERHGLITKIETNSSGNNHTVVEADRFFLTISTVGENGRALRPAKYREADAICNLPLFGGITDDDSATETRFNAVLLHAPDEMRPGQLGRAFIAFPDPNGRIYPDTCIDLMKRFDGAVDRQDTFKEDVISPLIEPEILPRENEGDA